MADVILAGDIGGTKTHLGLFRETAAGLTTIRDCVYQTSAFDSLEQACAEFLTGKNPEARIGAACFGVPGPVINGVSHATNVAWSITRDSIQSAIGGVPTRLMNDLEVTAYGLPHLRESEVAVLHRGEDHPGANIAVIAAGTGLGEAGLVATPTGYFAIATGGGHYDFAPRGAEQRRIAGFSGARVRSRQLRAGAFGSRPAQHISLRADAEGRSGADAFGSRRGCARRIRRR